MLRPPSADVFNSDSLFKASGLLFQRNGYAIVFNVSTLFCSEVRLPMYEWSRTARGVDPVLKVGGGGAEDQFIYTYMYA